jgi:hypothetical protein
MTDRLDPERSPGTWQPRPTRIELRPCAVCGRPFRRAAPIAKYCSKACRATAYKAQRAEKKQPPPPKGEG